MTESLPDRLQTPAKANPGSPRDEWATLYQQLPKSVYDRLKIQMRRLALANGIAAEYFDGDSKFRQVEGPKVQVWECLIILMERTERDEDFQV